VTVRFLGTGDAFNARGRCHSSYLVTTPSTTLLLDCGPSALLAMKRDNLSPEALDGIVISHLHGDHFAGIPFFFLTYIFDQPRQRPFTIVGPPHMEERLRDLYRTMYRDLTTYELPFELRFEEVSGGVPLVIGDTEILPFVVPHQKTEVSLGFRLSVAGKVIVYSGDTGWTEALVTQSRGADLFICECCFYETRVDFHLDFPRIAEHRSRFSCKRLVLSHVGREVLAHRDEIADEIAQDGLVIDLQR
jgi:ribonuclease BN (tRNA processing enzyme)